MFFLTCIYLSFWSDNIVVRCWRKKSTNLWPSGAAPWNPGCRTGLFYLLSQFCFVFIPKVPHRFFFIFYPSFQLFIPPSQFCFVFIPKVGCILRGKSGIRHQVWQFSAQNCSWFSDLVHQIAREKQYPGKNIQNISFSHFRDELSVARCLCWFSIVNPLCFSQPSVSTGTHFHSWQLI